MLALEILDGLKIPVAVLDGFSYTKAANLIPTSRLRVRVRGYQCRELAVTVALTPACVELFNALNGNMFSDFPSLVRYFMQIMPSRDIAPFRVVLAGACIVPELLFTITSATQTFAADYNGSIQRCEISLTLSGTRCAKTAFSNPVTSADTSATIPAVTIHEGTKALACREDVSVSRLEMTPTTTVIGLVISDSFKAKKDNAWAFTLAQSNTSFVGIDGYGDFYIVAASYLDSYMELECSVFDRKQREVITGTVTDGTLRDVLRLLPGRVQFAPANALSTMPVDNFTANGTTADVLRTITDGVGLLACFRDNAITLYDTPASLYNANALPFPCDDDLCSAKTAGVIVRDGRHEYKSVDGSGDVLVIDSQVCTPVDRSEQLLKLQQFRESQLTVVVPYDARIRHHSCVALVKDGRYIYCLVTDYTIDAIGNTMQLTLNYLDR